MWTEPADEWVARFVGYTSVHPTDGESDIHAGSSTAARLALRPAALVADAQGSVHGRVLMVAPAPDGVTLTVDTDTWGVVQAVGGADFRAGVGEQVRLRFDPAGAARIPA